MNKVFFSLIVAGSLPLINQSVSAQTYLTDDFVVNPGDAGNDANLDITNGRQGGLDAVSDYVNFDQGNAWNHQMGSTTDVGQPASVGVNYLLLAQYGAVQNNLNLSTTATGPLAIGFDMYVTGASGASTYWGSFTLQAAGTYPFPVVNGGEFGFLKRKNGGMQVFDGGGNIAPTWDTAGFATNSYFTLIFSDSAGTGSAFNGNGSQVTIKNGVYTLGTFSLPQLNTTNIELGFRSDDEGDPANLLILGIDNLSVASSVPAAWLPIVVNDTSPATVAVGSNAVFTASVSNLPPVSLQWQQIVSGSPAVTNNINTGVVNVTNNGVVISTLSINNAQLTNAGSYRLEAINATNSAAVVFTTASSLTVVPTITWYPTGTGNGVFSTDSVLGFAGSVANEVYGVDFGGSGSVTTGNGYTFNDYASSGNMTIANLAGLSIFAGFEGGSVTTGDPGLDTILNYGVTGSSACTATLNNLTVGQAYTVLILMDDNRTSGASGPNFDVTDGLTISPSQAFAFPNGAPAVGGYIMGTFTAVSTNQPLTVLQNGNAQYVAILLEKGTAPAPVVGPTITQDVTPLVSKLSPAAPVTLTVTATGSPPLSYQWSNQNGLISGATNASYTFNAPVGPDSYDTNSYYCAVTNAAGSAVSSTGEVIVSTNIVNVYNFAFEDGTYGSGNLVFPVRWTAFNNNNFSTVANNSYNVPIPDGSDLYAQGDFYAVNEGPSDPTGGIYQDTGPLLPNTTYTLTVAIGERADFTPGTLGSPGIISLINGADNTGTVLASTNGVPNTSDTWQDYSVSFSTGPTVSGDLTVELSVAGASTYQANFANVRLTKAPGPSVIAPTLQTDISPLESELTTGTPVTFTVAATGYPLAYQWYNQNGAISGAITNSYSFASLTGTNLYYVIVTNTAGAITSSIASVVSSPNIVTVNNYGFQNQILSPGETYPPGGGTAPTGWTGFNVGSGGGYDYGITYASGGDFTDPLTAPASGNNYLWVNRFNGNGTQVAGVYQNVGALLPNTAYTLTVAIGQRANTGPNGSWSPGIISLLNGNDNTGTVLATGGGLPGTPDSWQNYTASFTTGPSVSGNLVIELSVLDAPSIQADFSNVELTQVPVFVFNPPVVSSGKLVLTATGGMANSPYTLLTATNLLGPWTTNSVGTTSSTGTLSNAIPISTASPAAFFRYRMP
ncbi:MAG TPA: immunoglobulin domain-containing protein [Verrucomicrobiae bacterium]|nr:immunoglobulin domain-containing protein [Verrucomicrobiae bacterium]